MFAITTIDNPYDPFDQFAEWFAWDEAQGYHTCGILAKLAVISDEFSDDMNDKITEEAIDKLVNEFNGEFYKKMVREKG